MDHTHKRALERALHRLGFSQSKATLVVAGMAALVREGVLSVGNRPPAAKDQGKP